MFWGGGERRRRLLPDSGGVVVVVVALFDWGVGIDILLPLLVARRYYSAAKDKCMECHRG